MAKKEKSTDLLITKIIEGVEEVKGQEISILDLRDICLLYTSPSPRDKRQSRMPSSA